MLPFLVDFILEGKLDATAADLPCVNKQNGHFVRSKRLFSDDVVDDRLGFVVIFSLEPE